MSEQTKNPFEEAMQRTPGAMNNPFANTAGGQVTGNPFPVAPASPPPNSEQTVSVDTANVQSAETQAATVQNAGAINLGSQAGAQNIFETPGFAIPESKPQMTEQAKAAGVVVGEQPPAMPPLETPVSVPIIQPDFTNDAADVISQEQELSGEESNPLAAAALEQSQQSIFTKLPIFEHGSAKEPIENLEQTFEELREAKSEDFPELEDAVKVSWDITYGKIRKTVPTPKKTKIGEFKRSIESSKEFLDALKKDKNKSPDCIIKPKVTAQSKGESASSYKGVFTSLEDAQAAGKVISIVPGRNGKVYEIRNTEAGEFVTPTNECKELSEIEAGFTPALPLIPRDQILQIFSFFRSLMTEGNYYEAIANILWDRENQEFCIHVPEQRVTAIKADSNLTTSDEYDSERYLHYMDVHSHNAMSARFSKTDDADEKATRLYAVIGKLNEYIPELSVRISNGGKYLLIDPAIVFEALGDFYPEEWNEQVTIDCSVTPQRDSFLNHDAQRLLRCFRKGARLAA